MGFTSQQFEAMQQRLAKATKTPVPEDAVERENELRYDIRSFCESQWPKWKVISARTDKRSTIEVGAPDMVILADRGRIFIFELKRKGAKQTQEQVAWAHQCGILGHNIHVIYSMSDFLLIIA